VQLVKKKKTMHPEWNTSFDFHLYEGRVIHLEIIQRPDIKVAECSILAQSLADLAKDGEPTSVWVIIRRLLTSVTRHFSFLFKKVTSFCHSCINYWPIFKIISVFWQTNKSAIS